MKSVVQTQDEPIRSGTEDTVPKRRFFFDKEETAKLKRIDKHMTIIRLDLLVLRYDNKPYYTPYGYGYELITPEKPIEVSGPFDTLREALDDAMTKIDSRSHITFRFR